MEENVYEVSLGQLFRIALKHWWIILIAILLGAAIAFAYVNFFVTPTYTTYAKVGVSMLNMSDYQGALVGQTLAKQGSDILVSNITLQKAADNLNSYSFPENGGVAYRVYTPDNILAMLKTTTSEESPYFDVEIRSTDPNEAKIVCEHVVEAFCEVLDKENIINEGEGKNIHKPVVPKSPSSPNVTLAVVLGALIGMVLSFGTLLVVHFAKDALEGEDWIIETYKENIPVLAVIPDASTANRAYKKYGYKYKYNTKA